MLLEAILFLSSVYFNMAVAKSHDALICSKNQLFTPVYDLFHSNRKPILMKSCPWIVDIVVALTACAWFYTIESEKIPESLFRASIFYAIRGISIFATTGYTSVRHYNGFHSKKVKTFSNFAHTDLVISGHVGLTCLMAIDIFWYGGVVEKLVSAILVLASSVFNLANGDHYTSDVILGLVLAVLIGTHQSIVI